jgi:hypothetical protein
MYSKQKIINNNSVDFVKSNDNFIKPNESNNDNSFQIQFVNTQLLNLQKLSLVELKEKYRELFETNNTNNTKNINHLKDTNSIKNIKFKRGYLLKILSYKIQVLYGMSNTSEEEIEELIKITKHKLDQTERITIDNSRKIIRNTKIEDMKSENKQNTQDLNPPITVGSTITTCRGNQEYIVKVLSDNKFSYNQKIYKSLTAIATDITGTKWNGYNFFKLKRRVSNNFLVMNNNNNNDNNKQMVAI